MTQQQTEINIQGGRPERISIIPSLIKSIQWHKTAKKYCKEVTLKQPSAWVKTKEKRNIFNVSSSLSRYKQLALHKWLINAFVDYLDEPHQGLFQVLSALFPVRESTYLSFWPLCPPIKTNHTGGICMQLLLYGTDGILRRQLLCTGFVLSRAWSLSCCDFPLPVHK